MCSTPRDLFDKFMFKELNLSKRITSKVQRTKMFIKSWFGVQRIFTSIPVLVKSLISDAFIYHIFTSECKGFF